VLVSAIVIMMARVGMRVRVGVIAKCTCEEYVGGEGECG
jgi:hypothetical protein